MYTKIKFPKKVILYFILSFIFLFLKDWNIIIATFGFLYFLIKAYLLFAPYSKTLYNYNKMRKPPFTKKDF